MRESANLTLVHGRLYILIEHGKKFKRRKDDIQLPNGALKLGNNESKNWSCANTGFNTNISLYACNLYHLLVFTNFQFIYTFIWWFWEMNLVIKYVCRFVDFEKVHIPLAWVPKFWSANMDPYLFNFRVNTEQFLPA